MPRLDTNAYYALGIPAYGAVMWIEHLWSTRGRQTSLAGYRSAETLSNLSAGLGEVVIGILLGPLLIALYDYGYAHIALVHWSAHSAVPWLVALVGGDFCYYLYHRAGHRVGFFWAIHGVHHQSAAFNFSVAMRHPWFSDTYAVLFYIPMPLLGVPPTHFFFAIAVISFYALTVHTRHFRRPSFGILVTPQTHIVHHAINPGYINRNFGAMFSLWDRIFGTHVEVCANEPPRIGSLSATQSYSGAKAQWLLFSDLFARARAAPSWRGSLNVLFMPPGYRVPIDAPQPAPRRPATAAIPPNNVKLAQAMFVATLVAASIVMWQQDQLLVLHKVTSVAAILLLLIAVGRLLDRHGQPTFQPSTNRQQKSQSVFADRDTSLPLE
jgi:alkylglycerol monooxygenase